MTLAAEAPAPAPARPVRPFYWSVRRELWEHRSIYVAPIAVVAVALLGFLVGTLHLPRAVHEARTGGLLNLPYVFVAFASVMTGLIVAVFYCLGALNGERRDRSILFWKSLPVSDLTTVLAKAAVPMVVMPLVVFALVVVAHTAMLAWSTLVMLANGLPPQSLWSYLSVAYLWRTLAGGLPYIALWYAPLYGWLFLVSAWARRAPFLWAVGAPLALGLLERMALGTTHVSSWLGLRLVGPFMGAFGSGLHARGEGPAAAGFDPTAWENPHLWIGLAVAAVFLAAAVRLRRSRQPI